MPISAKPVQGLFLRTNLASGTVPINGKEVKFEVSLNIDNACVFVEFPDVKFAYNTRAMVEDAIKLYKKWLKENSTVESKEGK
jgi:hypothetical protein